jgi:MFS-type transporter involved in bile tolerance (Atg22 family)
MRLSNQLRLLIGELALVVLGALLVLVTMLIGLWEGWLSKPIGELPTLFWMLYTAIIAIWIILLLLPRIKTNGRSLPSIATSATMLLLGALLIVSNLLMPAWTGGRLLWLTLGVCVLLDSAPELVRIYVAKREGKA